LRELTTTCFGVAEHSSSSVGPSWKISKVVDEDTEDPAFRSCTYKRLDNGTY